MRRRCRFLRRNGDEYVFAVEADHEPRVRIVRVPVDEFWRVP